MLLKRRMRGPCCDSSNPRLNTGFGRSTRTEHLDVSFLCLISSSQLFFGVKKFHSYSYKGEKAFRLGKLFSR